MTGAESANGGNVAVTIDGRAVTALAGRSLAAVFVLQGVTALRRNPVTGEPRAPYCGMGVCFECEVTVDGVPGVRACITHIRDGMRIETEPADVIG